MKVSLMMMLAERGHGGNWICSGCTVPVRVVSVDITSIIIHFNIYDFSTLKALS